MTYGEFQERYRYDATTDRLGAGGFGKVFKAYDTYRDRWVAIKIAPVNPGFESVRLKKEVEMVGRLPAHPNIAYYEECYTFVQGDGEYDYGILQYYGEGNLLELMNRNVLTPAQKASLLSHILNGLGFLHDNGIIHRDLKPQNILIVKRGEEYIPKITDFGISKRLDIDKSSVFSNSLVGAGTLAYSSPEQLKDNEIRKNTDLWSFGVIAYRVWSGALPFTTGDYSATSEAGRLELFRQIDNGVLPESIAHIPEPWQTLIRRCLVPDADSRLRSCSECFKVLTGQPQSGECRDDDRHPPTCPPVYPSAQPDTQDDTTCMDEPATRSKKEETAPPQPPAPIQKDKKKRGNRNLLIIIIGSAIAMILLVMGYLKYEEKVVNERLQDIHHESKQKTEGVVINGVTWATCNVDSPGTFAASPESAGMFYQWNRRKGWPATGTVSGWDDSTPSGKKWERVNDPCPAGWRVPMMEELKFLDEAGSEWTTVNGVSGRRFGNGANSIFLPAPGYRYYSDGVLYYSGAYGFYWSSTTIGTNSGYSVYFNSTTAIIVNISFSHLGFSVRCVRE